MADRMADRNTWEDQMASRKPSRNAQRLLKVTEVLRAKDGDHSDGGELYLRIRSESASWVYRYTSPIGKRREMGLGPVRRVDAATAGESLTNARDDADAARKLLAAGKDPIDTRDAALAETKAAAAAKKTVAKIEALTLARASRGYHEKFVEPHRTDKHSAQWISSLENHIPEALWHRPIAAVTAGELLDLLLDLYSTIPETAGRIRQRLDAIFDDALLRGQVVSNPAAAIRRKLREVASKKRPTHFRSLPYSRIAELMRRLEAASGTAPIALRALILTACRTSEVLCAEWNEVDLDARIWRIPGARMKGGEDHVIYLSDAAHSVFKTQADDPARDARWIFPSPTGSGEPMSNMAFLVLLRRMKLDDVATPHGMRSTFSTWANESGKYRNDVIEACLAHQEGDRVRRAYNRATFTAERKTLLQDWAAFCTVERQASAHATRILEFSA